MTHTTCTRWWHIPSSSCVFQGVMQSAPLHIPVGVLLPKRRASGRGRCMPRVSSTRQCNAGTLSISITAAATLDQIFRSAASSANKKRAQLYRS